MPVRPTVSFGRRLYLGAEFLALYGGGPLLILSLRRAGLLFGLLWVAALLAFVSLRHQKSEVHDFPGEARRILLRFTALAPLIMLLTWWIWPDVFLSLPRQKPLFWLLVMVLYPILSVWPQEVLYRAFLFSRYGALFRIAPVTIAASAVAFGFAHILFLNWIAVGMTLIGGALFASDYSRHRSLTLTCFEHSLYGCLIFTVGLGRFFYTGAAWHQ
ncbi:CPBP family intramembrane glutamic endopeptidase [Gluconobacter cerinus]|uniref:CPBP family intramembrane glutamic endopeptidase n=1 Tax=Gluconobacter cerinus TaxID=38307 RepID=UPI001C03F07F|nr:CPBP family intramembrane glutamic endopeptidase [Gluconobacter cerinus]